MGQAGERRHVDCPPATMALITSDGGAMRTKMALIASGCVRQVRKSLMEHVVVIMVLVMPEQVSPWPAAAIPMENPYCSCVLTRAVADGARHDRRAPPDNLQRHRAPLAVGGTAISLTPPSRSLLKHLLQGEGGAAE